MSEPTLKRSTVTISYTASDGYSTSGGYNSAKARGQAPEAALLDGIEELARLCTLFGHADEASKRVSEAIARVAEWRNNRAPQTPAPGAEGGDGA